MFHAIPKSNSTSEISQASSRTDTNDIGSGRNSANHHATVPKPYGTVEFTRDDISLQRISDPAFETYPNPNISKHYRYGSCCLWSKPADTMRFRFLKTEIQDRWIQRTPTLGNVPRITNPQSQECVRFPTLTAPAENFLIQPYVLDPRRIEMMNSI